jgi:amino acid adenylation domain-containing protein
VRPWAIATEQGTLAKTADTFQASPQQEQLWIAEARGPTVRTQAVLSLTGQVDPVALEAALGEAVQRHESLRTTFVHQPGLRVPLQVVNDTLAPGFTTLDLQPLEPGEQTARRHQVIRQELEEPFESTDGPLVRAVWLSCAADRSELVITVSALFADASSMVVLIGELVGHYAGGGDRADDPLQYADFSAWQRELLESGDPEEAPAAAEFWSGLDEAAGVALPFADSATSPFVPEQVAVELDAALAASVRVSAERYGASSSGFVHAAWHAVLGRFSGQDDVVAAFVGSDRRHEDLEGAVGAFARPVPIRTRTGAAVSFAEVLRAIDHARDEALVWQDYAPPDGSSRFPVGFESCEPYNGQAGEVSVALERLLGTGHHLRLWLACTEDEGDLDLRLRFDPTCYRRDTVEQLGRSLQRVLHAVVSDPGSRVGELDLLDDADRRKLLQEFNDTAVSVGPGCVHELVSARASVSPDRVAVREEHGTISYGELDARANQLAHRLRRCGAGPGSNVALCTDRSIEMVVGLLGILKAGAAYVPLHYEHPRARLAHQVASASVRVMVTQEPLRARLPEFEGPIICLDRDRPELDAEPTAAPATTVSTDELAYVIYTSGSTGAPKGVCVTHGNLVNYTSDIARRLSADAEPQSFAVVTSISTDLGNTALFGALCSGGMLVLVNPAVAADPGALAVQFEATPVDVLKITPSHLGALLAGDDPRVLPRRWLVLGGERAPWDLIARVRALSDCAILNHYGPTETTVGSCTFPVGDGPGEYRPASVPIGRPIANTSCYVLDDHGHPVPIGVGGGLFIGGAGVARGYAGEPTLTAERFIANPFAGDPATRIYDTGDLARWLPDGSLEFLGRADEQVKIRGYRVEPAEIEAALRSHPQVREAVALTYPAAAGEQRLVAYCTVDGAVDQEALRVHIAGWLPEYMLPAAIAILDGLPRTPSGKVDRLSLPDPDTLAHEETEYVAPRTPLEEAVAEIWSQALGLPRIGVEDDFFSLGGHSLLATQVVAQVRSDFAVELPLHSLFSYPTVASLSSEIMQMMGASEAEETARLVAELEGLSDEEAEQLLAGDLAPPEPGPR